MARPAHRAVYTMSLPVLLCAAALALAGCVERVTLKPQKQLNPMRLDHLPATTRAADGSIIGLARPHLTGKTQTLPYAGLLWRFGRLPCARASDTNRLVMLDTGLNWFARVTLDVAADEQRPVKVAKDYTIAYVDRLPMGTIVAESIPAVTWDQAYDVRIAFIPIYRPRGWILGNMLLRQSKYVAFDNPAKQVTIGRESFEPRADLSWASYPMGNRGDCPEIEIDIAGRPLRLLADSAGGPNLLLEQAQWEQIRDRVRVRKKTRDSYPTWDGFESVDVYCVESLRIGPVERRKAIVWVRPEPKEDAASLLGLGPLEDCVVVFDYAGKRFWIGQNARRW
jgi:hypothetical protein